jgi:hypothetical protein
VVATVVMEVEGVVAPCDVGLKAVKPRLAEDGVEALEGGRMEAINVRVGAEVETLAGKEKGGRLRGAIGEGNQIRGGLVG